MDGTELLDAFFKKIGVQYELDDSDSCSFSVDNRVLTISLIKEYALIVILVDLGEPHVGKLEKLYKMMLESNYLYADTHGATLALNRKDGHFALSKFLNTAVLDVDKLYSEVEQCVNTAELWAEVVKNYDESDENTYKQELIPEFLKYL